MANISAQPCGVSLPGFATFCVVTWCNTPLKSTNLSTLVCYQAHQMTIVSAAPTVLYSQ